MIWWATKIVMISHRARRLKERWRSSPIRWRFSNGENNFRNSLISKWVSAKMRALVAWDVSCVRAAPWVERVLQNQPFCHKEPFLGIFCLTYWFFIKTRKTQVTYPHWAGWYEVFLSYRFFQFFSLLMSNFDKQDLRVVSPLSVVPLKIGKNNCKPGETYRKTPSICKIPTLYRANFAEDRHQHSRGGLSICGSVRYPTFPRCFFRDQTESSCDGRFFLLNGSSGFSLSGRRKVDPGHCSAHQPEYFSP